MYIFNSKSKAFVNIALHLLVWCFWFAAPILFSFNNPHKYEPPKDLNFYIFIWVPMLFSLLLFYLNYFLLVERFLFNKRILWFLGINLFLIVAFSFSSEWVKDVTMFIDPTKEASHRPPKDVFFRLHNLTFLFIVSISVAIRTTSRWYLSENQRKNLENENLKSELSNLKMQLNPHFFFNTLNNIYSLIKVSPDKAQESVHDLAKLMRYHLYETNEETVALSGEVEFLENYIALMRIRMNPNVTIEADFLIENSTAKIAPLLFITLVENAFKHGVSPIEDSFIKISMNERNGIVTFEALNTNHPQKTNGFGESGIGIENLTKRLALIYPEKHTFTQGYKDKYFYVKVIIQL